MALKLIIDTAAVIQRMSLQDIEEVRNAVDSTLNAAHVVLQGMLHTVFEPRTLTDVFYLNSNRYPRTPEGLLGCKLTQAFMDGGITSLVVNQTSRKALYTDPEQVAAEDYFVDPVRGYLLVDYSYADYWLKVEYKAGFSSTNKPPQWLQEAVLAYLPHMLTQPNGAMDAEAMRASTEAQKMAWNITGKIVEPYLRNRAFLLTAFGT